MKNWKKQFDKKWYVPGSGVEEEDHEYWFYQAINGDDPINEIKEFIEEVEADAIEKAAKVAEKHVLSRGMECFDDNEKIAQSIRQL